MTRTSMLMLLWVSMVRSACVVQDDGERSVAAYAAPRFVGGCRVRPQKLIDHPYFGSLPLDQLVPTRLSLGRLESMGVQELVVFCGRPSAADATGPEHTLEWAAVVRLSQPAELEAVMSQWRASLVPREDRDAAPRPMTIGADACFEVLSGSIFPQPDIPVDLEFTDTDGDRTDSGISVGDPYPARGYVEGATRSSATFRLEDIGADTLIDDSLVLELTGDVFWTKRVAHEYTSASLQLRNPDTGLVSRPIVFQPKSLVAGTFTIPRRVVVVQDGQQREVDLLADLVAAGELQVILRGLEPLVYLGYGPADLRVRSMRSAFVCVRGRDIVVAQSPDTLAAMLATKASPTELATHLSESNADIVCMASVRHDADRQALQGFAEQFDGPGMRQWANRSTDTRLSVAVSQEPMVQLRIAYERDHDARTGARSVQRWLRSLETVLRENVGEWLARGDSMASLIDYGMGLRLTGLPNLFDQSEPPAQSPRETELLNVVDDIRQHTTIDVTGNKLALRFVEPPSLAAPSDVALVGMSNLQEAYARDVTERRKFDWVDEFFRRATDRQPDDPSVRFRWAHHLSYNTSVQFDGFATRYAWVRRGINVLLDGIEQDAGNTDLLWMAAWFIGHKVGDSDDRLEFRRLFAEDEALHRRLGRIISMNQARSPDGRIDNWLVTKLIIKSAAPRASSDLFVPKILFIADPALAQARYARTLTDAGHWQHARRAWREAERLFDQLGNESIPLPDGKTIRLNERTPSLRIPGPLVISLDGSPRFVTQYDRYSRLCRFEQLDEVQAARQLLRAAEKHRQEGELPEAHNKYRASLRALMRAHESHSGLVAACASVLDQVPDRYRKTSRAIGDTRDDMESILKLMVPEQ